MKLVAVIFTAVWFVIINSYSIGAETIVEKTTKTETRSDRINPYKMGIGAHLGMAVSNASIQSGTSSSSKLGMTLGGYIEAPVLPGFFYFQPELNYTQRGAENSHFGSIASARLNYIEIPLLAKIKFMIPQVKPFILAGPSMAYLVGANVEGPAIDSSRSLFNSIEFSVVLGAGFTFQLGQGLDSPEATFTVRYSSGINNVATQGGDWRSSALNILAGIQI